MATATERLPKRQRWRHVWLAAAVAATLTAGTAAADPVAVTAAPTQPATGPGSNGPCAQAARSLANPTTGLPVHVFEPTGAARTPLTGGRCDSSKRPVVFVSHGFGATDPASYADLIQHLVSVGNVVVYATYSVNDGERSTLEESYRAVAAGNDAAVAATRRIDTTRAGFWGHSHGGGMVPYLVQQGAARGWGRTALWMAIHAPAYTQLVGTGPIRVPPHTQQLMVAFEHDQAADNRLGIDVFESLVLPLAQKRYVALHTDAHGQPAFVADHNAPAAEEGGGDAVDFVLWRYADLLQTCALTGRGCDTDLTWTGAWADGTRVVPAQPTHHPVDQGPYPAMLAECDAVYGPTLNARIERCGPTHI